MCGIVGLFLKDKSLEPELGALLSEMLVSLSDRGPDSAGIAIYGSGGKQAQQDHHPVGRSGARFCRARQGTRRDARRQGRGDRQVDACGASRFPSAKLDEARDGHRRAAARRCASWAPATSSRSTRRSACPAQVVDRFGLTEMAGTHGIGHTRMATESAVTTLGAHPFSTGPDQCLVHNGSLSNHNNVRRELIREGMTLRDRERHRGRGRLHLQQDGAWRQSRRGAGRQTLTDLDGFFTFVVGTKNGFGVVRDPIACKPAVMAETDHYVAFGSEYRALANLPGIEDAKVWEPEPAKVYFWEH